MLYDYFISKLKAFSLCRFCKEESETVSHLFSVTSFWFYFSLILFIYFWFVLLMVVYGWLYWLKDDYTIKMNSLLYLENMHKVTKYMYVSKNSKTSSLLLKKIQYDWFWEEYERNIYENTHIWMQPICF